MLHKKYAQISTEYLVIVGFVVFLVIGVLSIAFFYTSGSQDQIRFSNLQHFANTLISNSEEIYYSGEPSLRTLSLYLPGGVENIEVGSDALTFTIITNSGTNIVSFTSNVPIGGSISSQEGVKRVQLTAQSLRVFITEG